MDFLMGMINKFNLKEQAEKIDTCTKIVKKIGRERDEKIPVYVTVMREDGSILVNINEDDAISCMYINFTSVFGYNTKTGNNFFQKQKFEMYAAEKSAMKCLKNMLDISVRDRKKLKYFGYNGNHFLIFTDKIPGILDKRDARKYRYKNLINNLMFIKPENIRKYASENNCSVHKVFLAYIDRFLELKRKGFFVKIVKNFIFIFIFIYTATE